MKISASAKVWLAMTVLPAPLHAQPTAMLPIFSVNRAAPDTAAPNTFNNIGPSPSMVPDSDARPRAELKMDRLRECSVSG